MTVGFCGNGGLYIEVMAGDWGIVAEHPALVALAELDTALDHLGEANLWSLSPAQLRGLRVDMERVSARLASATLTVTRELDASGAAVETGAVSSAGRLRGTCRLDPRAAKREVRLAAALDGPFAATAKALGAGEISVEHAQVIREAVDRLPLAVPADVRTNGETWLVEQARLFDPQALARLGRHLLHVLDPDNGGGDGVRRGRTTTQAELQPGTEPRRVPDPERLVHP